MSSPSLLIWIYILKIRVDHLNFSQVGLTSSDQGLFWQILLSYLLYWSRNLTKISNCFCYFKLWESTEFRGSKWSLLLKFEKKKKTGCLISHFLMLPFSFIVIIQWLIPSHFPSGLLVSLMNIKMLTEVKKNVDRSLALIQYYNVGSMYSLKKNNS